MSERTNQLIRQGLILQATAEGAVTPVEIVSQCTRAFYRCNPAGGVLHVVTDDGNLEDSHQRWCIKYAREDGDVFGEILGQLCVELSLEDREKVYHD
jgi:hypothetical protein